MAKQQDDTPGDALAEEGAVLSGVLPTAIEPAGFPDSGFSRLPW